ncbi:hypothetical protein PARMER_03262 [Parabacteroides merdae ATCC 43184]|nr:hypothetical protein PARMER_03262 [Parabacteroides merdae ATCC 43184]
MFWHSRSSKHTLAGTSPRLDAEQIPDRSEWETET